VAQLTARLCKLHKIRVSIVDNEFYWLKHKWKYRGGIILKTVGDFPTNDFLNCVKMEYKNL